MFEFIHHFELTWIALLQELRSPFLDSFFNILNFFDTQGFYILLFPVIWFGISWKWGLRLFIILFLSTTLNEAAKQLFMQPRPFDLNTALEIIKIKGYGFPSGAAQSAILFSGILIQNFKDKKWAWIIGLNYIFWISLSRVYLGVHFPSDILGGWILGGFMLIVFKQFPKIEKFLSCQKPLFLLLLSQMFSLLVFFFSIGIHKFYAPALSAIFLGCYISYQYHLFLKPSDKLSKKFLRSIFGSVTTIIIPVFFHVLWKKPPSYFIFIPIYLMGLWISLGFPCLYRFLFKK